jgi:hypothetical protein
MTTLIGVALLTLIGATVLLLLAAWRWLHKPAISDESLEALWSIVISLHETTQRLEVAAERLERLLSQNNGKHPTSAGQGTPQAGRQIGGERW